ncbi:uncharacterized protein DEA37_0002273 [Paragonimus westermani]|uniref:Uncharacterized protein n=1 Tax=Paragonimus westermani TaxID=34504 RepID=A0A5J4NC20_9TREM|nr:uncharacterized protein DEA37_0002273 [Paragonimus westermani]
MSVLDGHVTLLDRFCMSYMAPYHSTVDDFVSLFHRTGPIQQAQAIETSRTDGIGKAFAEELASDGLSIMLISRNTEKLQAVAGELRATYNVSVRCVTVDFTEESFVHEGAFKGIRLTLATIRVLASFFPCRRTAAQGVGTREEKAGFLSGQKCFDQILTTHACHRPAMITQLDCLGTPDIAGRFELLTLSNTRASRMNSWLLTSKGAVQLQKNWIFCALTNFISERRSIPPGSEYDDGRQESKRKLAKSLRKDRELQLIEKSEATERAFFYLGMAETFSP